MIAADFDYCVPNPYLDFRIRDPQLDFHFPESFRFTIICVAIANLFWLLLRLSAWQSRVHDSLKCFLFMSAWQAWLKNT